jgi:hypothetical protein
MWEIPAVIHDGMMLLSLLLSVYCVYKYKTAIDEYEEEGWQFAIVAWLCVALLEWIH